MASLSAMKRWVRRATSRSMVAATVIVAGTAAGGIASAEDGEAPENALRSASQKTYQEDAAHEDAAVQPAGYVPKHQRHRSQHSVIYQDPAPAPSQFPEPPSQTRPPTTRAPRGGGVEYEAVPDEIIYEDGAPWGGPAGPSCGCEGVGCDDCSFAPACATGCCLLPCPTLDNVEIFSGVQGFTGPVNRGQTGSFGFHEGVNWGAPVPGLSCLGIGAQAGAQFTHSNFSGAEFTDDIRNQVFVTAGLFRRVDWGLQGGVVVDYMNENWYLESDLLQLRGELSWVFPECYELGFWFNTSLNDDNVVSTINENGNLVNWNETLEATDIYAFFYRHRFDPCESVVGRIFAGFTGESDGLIGADLRLALTDQLALSTGFSYLVPEEERGLNGHVQESWNIATSLVWYPGYRSARGRDYYRPLFDVGGNGNFFVDRN